jgi:tetratricopeptide (TPR) repeat protein
MAGRRHPRSLFISYSRTDGEEFADELYQRLQDAEYAPWLDRRHLVSGTDWDSSIDQALEQASIVLVVLTPAAVTSRQVKSEWSYALNQNLMVVPLLTRDCDVPRVLAVHQVHDFRSPAEHAWERLFKDLEDLPSNHLEQLERQLATLEAARRDDVAGQRLEAKIEALRSAIASWESGEEEQQVRISDGLEQLRRHSVATQEDRARRKLRISGQRPQDVTDHFKDRAEARQAIGRLLADGNTRMITVLGSGGMGKTAVACRVLRDLEHTIWPYDAPAPELDGLVYLSTRTDGITLERLYLDCLRVLEEPARSRLMKVWAHPGLTPDEKILRLLQATEDGCYVVLLDNVEDLLDDAGRIEDPELARFFELAMKQPHGARLLLTSRVPLRLDAQALRHHHRVTLEDGLPAAEAIELVRELDEDGFVGLKEASAQRLAELVGVTHGVPRALELVYGRLANDPFLALEEVIEDFRGARDIVLELAKENYRHLSEESRRVLEALTIYNRPVAAVAVDFLLAPFVPGLQVPQILRRLAHSHIVKVDRQTKTAALHPIDRDFINAQLPATGDYSRRCLHRRAAELYRSQRIAEGWHWSAIEEIEPQLWELEHLIAAEEHDAAALLLGGIGNAMTWRGFASRTRKILEQLRGRLSAREARMRYELCVSSNATVIGPLSEAVAAGRRALGLAVELADREAEGHASRRIGIAFRYMGRPAEALEPLRRSVEVNRALGATRFICLGLFELAMSETGAGDLRQARRLAEELLELADRHRLPDQAGYAHNVLALADLVAGLGLATLEHGTKALELWGDDELFLEQSGYVTHMIGLAHIQVGRLDEALDSMRAALGIATDVEHLRLEGFCHHNMAVIYYLKGLFPDALTEAGRATKLLKTMDMAEATTAFVAAIEARVAGRPEEEARALLGYARASQDNPDLHGGREAALLAARVAADANLDRQLAAARAFVQDYERRLIR